MRLLIFLLLTSPGFAAFQYNRTITVQSGQVSSGPHSNFPMLVAGTYSYLATVANGGKVQNASGYDIGFYSNSDCSTGKLDWEIESWSATTGAIAAWVEVVSINTSSVVYLCYGDASITTDQSNKTGVWDANYLAVIHFPNGTTLSGSDSTSNNHTVNLVNSPTADTGKADGAAHFDNVNQHATITSASTLDTPTAQTVSLWLKSDTSTQAGNDTFVNRRNSAGPPYNSWTLDSGGAGNTYQYCIAADGGGGPDNGQYCINSGTLDTNWHYLVGTYDQGTTTQRLYRDSGTAVVSDTAVNITIDNDAIAVRIATPTASGNYYDGIIDEVRISNIARSGAWIQTEYNNQNAPDGTFYVVGSENVLYTTAVRRRFIRW